MHRCLQRFLAWFSYAMSPKYIMVANRRHEAWWLRRAALICTSRILCHSAIHLMCFRLKSIALRLKSADCRSQCAAPSDLGVVIAVVAGDNHTCVITRDRQLRCFSELRRLRALRRTLTSLFSLPDVMFNLYATIALCSPIACVRI